MKTFYNGLIPSTRLMLDVSSGGALLRKSYQECYDLVESITANSHPWVTERMQVKGKATTPALIENKALGLFSVSETTTFTAQIAQLTHYVKKLKTKDAASGDEYIASTPIIVVPPTTNSINCVYFRGGHVYEEFHRNPV